MVGRPDALALQDGYPRTVQQAKDLDAAQVGDEAAEGRACVHCACSWELA